jgi:hypothetical protein
VEEKIKCLLHVGLVNSPHRAPLGESAAMQNGNGQRYSATLTEVFCAFLQL